MNDSVVLLQTLGTMVVAAAALVLLLRPLRLPTIVVCIVAGILVGPAFGIISLADGVDATVPEIREAIDAISHFGIVLLLFLVGLELSFDRVRDLGRITLVAGVGQIVLTTAAGFVVCLALGFDPVASAFIGFAVTLSSTVVVVRLLERRRALSTLHGRLAVGVLLVQDLAVILALTLLASLGRGEEPDYAAALERLPLALLAAALLLGVAVLASRFILARPFEWASRHRATLVAWGLAWCMLFVMLSKLLGLSAEIGGFLAGLSLAQIPAAGDLNRRLHPLMNFCMAVFFIALGAGMDLRAAPWTSVAVLAAFVLLVKPLLLAWLVARCGAGGRTSMLVGLSLAQVSEFSFVFAALGRSSGILDDAAVAVIAADGLVTILASAWVIQDSPRISGWLERLGVARLLRLPPESEPAPEPELRGHVLVVGMNPMGRRVVAELVARGERVIAVDSDPGKLRGVPCRTVIGDVDDLALLESIGLDGARLAITALRIEPVNKLFAHRCRMRGVPCIVHAFDGSLVPELERLGVDHLVDSKMQGNLRVVAALNEQGVTTT